MQKRTRRMRLTACIAPIRLGQLQQPTPVHEEDFAERQLALAHETRTSYFVTRARYVSRDFCVCRVFCVLRAFCSFRLSRGLRAVRMRVASARACGNGKCVTVSNRASVMRITVTAHARESAYLDSVTHTATSEDV